jgi:integrase
MDLAAPTRCGGGKRRRTPARRRRAATVGGVENTEYGPWDPPPRAHALELACVGVLNIIQRQLGHANLGTTSVYAAGPRGWRPALRGLTLRIADDLTAARVRDVPVHQPGLCIRFLEDKFMNT